jgi:hypothetical protein
MPVLTINKFSGVAPRVSPHKLGPHMAQTAQNVRLLRGTVGSWRQPLEVLTGLAPAPVSTIYRFGQDLTSDTQYWFHWPVDVDVAKGAIANDQTERTYFTHPTLGARLTNNTLALTGGTGDYPFDSYKLGVPAPTDTPSAIQLVAGSGDLETRIYCFTYVTVFGEEGPPSPTSNVVTIAAQGGTVRLTSIGSAPPSGYTNISAKRIYRTFSGNLSTEFQLVDEIPVAQSTYDDSIASSNLNEVLPSLTWTPPPEGCFGITQMANGIMLLFKGYDIFPSEAYLPYAYPVAYSQSVDFPIVGAKAVGTSAVICTAGHPYLLTGSDPSAMSLVKLEAPQACVSKRSIVAVDGGVMYASPDGLIFVSTSGAVTNATAQFFSRQEWQALLPITMTGSYHDGRYYGFFGGATPGGFIFDPSEGAAAFTFIDTHATAAYTDPLQDALYLKVGGSIVKWDSGALRQTYKWKSAVFELGHYLNPACAQVVAETYPLTLRFYADKTLRHTQTVANSEPFWLPSGYRARFVEVEVEGTPEVYAVHVASSPAELKAV